MLCALLLLFANPAEEQAAKLYDQYLEVKHKDDFTRAKNYFLRELGKLDTPRARTALLKILRTTRSRDERVTATLALGNHADAQTVRELVARVARKPSPAWVEALAEALGRVTDSDATQWLATDAFKQTRPEILYAIALAQAQLGKPEAIPQLTRLYREHRELDVRFAAVRGLAATGGEALAEAAKDKEWRIRLAVAHAPDHAVARLDDPSAAVRQVAARTCANGKIEAAIPALIRLVEADPRLRTRHEASLALQAISGKNYGFDPGAWRRWWKEKSAEIKPGSFSVARYYSFSVYSDRLLFIIDASGSMNWPTSGKRPTRIEVARSQLTHVLKGIDKKALFNVMVYSGKVALWQKAEVEANPKNVARALTWAENKLAKPDGDTHTFEALEKAFARNPQFDTIYLLSDGNPSHGDYREPEGILNSVKAWNRYRRARVYTIHLTLAAVDRGRPIRAERPKLMRQLMTGLAIQTGGKSVLVEQPPKD